MRSPVSSSISHLVAIALSASLCSCGSAPLAEAEKPTIDKIDDQQATCKVAKDPLNPLIVEWPGTSKAALDGASQRGVVVVSYVGCALKVLSQCKAGEGYAFSSITPVRDTISMKSESELYARLPLGAANLKGELARAGQLDLDYVVVGQREATKPPTTLQGDCRGATHYLRSIMVGAYGLKTTGKVRGDASAGLLNAGAGASHAEESHRLRGSGDVEQCAASREAAAAGDCGAVLQLGLAPLMVGGGGSVTSAGFGAGLGAVAVVPEVGDLQTLSGGAGGLADADVALLKLLQEAKRADRSKASSQEKAAAWQRLVAYSGKNPYQALAAERQAAWAQVHEAEQRRSEQVNKVCAQYAADNAKLGKLLSLDADVVSAKQKAAYKAELTQVYAAFGEIVEECKARRAPKATPFDQTEVEVAKLLTGKEEVKESDLARVDKRYLPAMQQILAYTYNGKPVKFVIPVNDNPMECEFYRAANDTYILKWGPGKQYYEYNPIDKSPAGLDEAQLHFAKTLNGGSFFQTIQRNSVYDKSNFEHWGMKIDNGPKKLADGKVQYEFDWATGAFGSDPVVTITVLPHGELAVTVEQKSVSLDGKRDYSFVAGGFQDMVRVLKSLQKYVEAPADEKAKMKGEQQDKRFFGQGAAVLQRDSLAAKAGKILRVDSVRPAVDVKLQGANLEQGYRLEFDWMQKMVPPQRVEISLRGDKYQVKLEPSGQVLGVVDKPIRSNFRQAMDLVAREKELLTLQE